MAKTAKVGRPKVKDKVKGYTTYLKSSDYRKVKRTYKNLSNAVRAEVLPKCG